MKTLEQFQDENAVILQALAAIEPLPVPVEVAPKVIEDDVAKIAVDLADHLEKEPSPETVEALKATREAANRKLARKPVMMSGVAKGVVVATGITEQGLVTATVEGKAEDGTLTHYFYSLHGLCVDEKQEVDENTLMGWTL